MMIQMVRRSFLLPVVLSEGVLAGGGGSQGCPGECGRRNLQEFLPGRRDIVEVVGLRG